MENENRGRTDFRTGRNSRSWERDNICVHENVKSSSQINPEAPTFRPRRDAAVAVQCHIQDIKVDAD